MKICIADTNAFLLEQIAVMMECNESLGLRPIEKVVVYEGRQAAKNKFDGKNNDSISY